MGREHLSYAETVNDCEGKENGNKSKSIIATLIAYCRRDNKVVRDGIFDIFKCSQLIFKVKVRTQQSVFNNHLSHSIK